MTKNLQALGCFLHKGEGVKGDKNRTPSRRPDGIKVSLLHNQQDSKTARQQDQGEIVKRPVGRPRIYETKPARQSAYRIRLLEKTLSKTVKTLHKMGVYPSL